MKRPQTLYDKIWEKHLIPTTTNEICFVYIDRHFVHEVTSPQAFEGLRIHKRKLRQPELTFATMDHNISTQVRDLESLEEISKIQILTLTKNCKDFGVKLYDLKSSNNGIVHVIGPELGLTLPGMTIVCGDSHTSTHGAFGALAFGIGTSEVEHVMATQTLVQKKSKNMKVHVKGKVGKGVTAKDIILALIGKIGTNGGSGYVIEYMGEAIQHLSMEGRMTVCNMSIEAGAKAGLIAPDDTTFDYLKGKKFAPKNEEWERAMKENWSQLKTDEGAQFDKIIEVEGDKIEPQVTWGTNPSQVASIKGRIPSPKDIKDQNEKETLIRSLEYMDLQPNTPIESINIDRVFIGSCTNGRIEDLRSAASVLKNKKVAKSVKAMVVPGSAEVRRMAEEEGLDKIFKDAGFEWRLPGCSMCLAMNDDVLSPGERCASTSNRNFEGRQGRGGRTHLVGPAMAAAAAVAGHFVDVREMK